MMLRRRKWRATVNEQPGPRPVVICLSPGLTFEATADEAHRLELDLANVLGHIQRGGGG